MAILMRQPNHSLRSVTLRAIYFLLAFALAAGLIGVKPSQARSRKSRKAGPSEDLPDRINDLVRQLYGVQLVDAGNIQDQVQDVVIGALTTLMSDRGFQDATANYPPDVRVRMQLEQYFSQLHYPLF